VKRSFIRLLLLSLILSACGVTSYQLKWPEGTTPAQYQKDSEACESEARTGFAELSNEMNAVGTSAADDDSKRLWNRCMESKGYALIKVPGRAP
jgi:hypothetical protein